MPLGQLWNKQIVNLELSVFTGQKISNLGIAMLTSVSLNQYGKVSVGVFPIKASLSFNKW